MKVFGLGLAILLGGTVSSQAATAMVPLKAQSATLNVRMECTPSRCLDTRTGAYTQSSCDYRGCFPIGGIVGYVGDDDDGPRRRGRGQYRNQWEGGSGNQWDCNRSRCIDLNTGRVWESTCNRTGCTPLRPARRGY